MRRPLIAGNWKMNLDRATSIELVKGLTAASSAEGPEVLVCPPFVYLDPVLQTAGGSQVTVGAQDAYFEASGAFTGETSVGMLKDLGCKYVILGHSERRHVIGETDELINQKVHAVLNSGLIPILCVGEKLDQREAGETMSIVKTQFERSLKDLSESQMKQTVLAYEPVWAIGTGKTATPEQAQEVHADLRKIIAERYNPAVANEVRILYGGSVKAANAAELLSQADIDGALVGGASLKADSFVPIIEAGAAQMAG